MMSCGMYSVHTNIFSSFDVTSMRGCGSGQLNPDAVVVPLGTDVNAATGAVVGAVVAAGASVAVGGSVGAVVGASVATGACVGAAVAAGVGVLPQAVRTKLTIMNAESNGDRLAF